MLRPRGDAWYRGVPIQPLLNPNNAHSYISQDFLNRSFGIDCIATSSDTFETHTVLGPLVVETQRGVYVTTLPLHVEKTGQDVVVLGQDWMLAACCKLRMDGRMHGWAGSCLGADGRIGAWSESWETETCAWFSCAFYPKSPSPSPLWPWGRVAINRIHNNYQSDSRGYSGWHSCGIVTSALLSGPPLHAASLPTTSQLRPPATGADIPQELFDNIIRYTDTNGKGEVSHWVLLAQRTGSLNVCVQVCAHWAEVGRRLMYIERNLPVKICSLAELRDLQRPGSSRLTPVHKLVPGFTTWQSWETPSWIHNIYLAQLGRDHNKLELWRPENGSGRLLQAWACRSPHWSMPKTLPPCFTNFSALVLENVHFPALSDFAKLVKHFVRTKSFTFSHVTWEVTDVVIPSRSRSHSQPLLLGTDCCTDGRVLEVQTRLMLDKANIPYYQLSAPEQDAYLQVLSALTGSTDSSRREKEVWLLSHYSVGHVPSMEFYWSVDRDVTFKVQFLHDWASGAPVVKAIYSSTEEASKRYFNEYAKYRSILHAELQTGIFTSLAVVDFEFDTFAEVRLTLETFPGLRSFCSADGRAVAYRVLCSRLGFREYPQLLDWLPEHLNWIFAGIDPGSMRPTGHMAWDFDGCHKELIKEFNLQIEPLGDTR